MGRVARPQHLLRAAGGHRAEGLVPLACELRLVQPLAVVLHVALHLSEETLHITTSLRLARTIYHELYFYSHPCAQWPPRLP